MEGTHIIYFMAWESLTYTHNHGMVEDEEDFARRLQHIPAFLIEKFKYCFQIRKRDLSGLYSL